MKSILILLTIVFLLNATVSGQTKPREKLDTSKSKLPVKIDSPRVKLSLPTTSAKFEKTDSANLKSMPGVAKEGYGIIDTADLRMTSCDFEKDANAMVLFDKAEMSGGIFEIAVSRQKRIKIFNENGKNEANIRIEYNKYGAERILAIEAETINLNNGKIEFTKIDPNLIYHENTN